MKAPKTQQELLRIIAEQQMKIDELTNVVMRLDNKIKRVAVLAERSAHRSQRLLTEMQALRHTKK